MKKTLIINIANSIIHLEEDAFYKLQEYLIGIKNFFASKADNFEIVTDIENRIAEILKEILITNHRQVVDLSDVVLVMQRMGSVEDFANEEAEEFTESVNPFASVKRLFRDKEDCVIAGVCSGLGHYLNIEARWVRLTLFLTIFMGGFGALMYVLLWILMPPAITRVERMAMRGEAADLYGFNRNFEEELAHFKTQFQQANEKLDPFLRKTGNVIQEIIAFTGKILKSAMLIFFKFLAVVIIVCGIVFMLSLIFSLVLFNGLIDANIFDYYPFSIVNPEFQVTLVFTSFLSLFIPALALVLFSIRIAFNRKAINKTLSFALLTIWICGIGATGYYIAKIASQFQGYAELTQTDEIKTFPVYRLTLNNEHVSNKKEGLNFEISNQSGLVMYRDNDSNGVFNYPLNVRIDIEKSNSKQVFITRYYESQGRNFKEALAYARNISYTMDQKDSTLFFNPRIVLNNQKFRNQQARIVIKIPVGTKIQLENKLDKFMVTHIWDCEDHGVGYTEFIMTEEGLKCNSL